MTVGQNKSLLEALADGSMRFERVDAYRQLIQEASGGAKDIVASQETEDILWAYETNKAVPSITVSL
jgi:hypothetical protein